MWVISMILLGVVFGSFAGAQVWRLRARQLAADKKAGEHLTKEESAELKKLSSLFERDVRQDRSHCLSCSHELRVVDLLPLVSWLSTRGRCRYCGVFIGWFEPLIEAGVALTFVISYLMWPTPLTNVLDILLFGAWLVAVVLFAILFAYDAKWFLLPDIIMLPLAAVGVVFAGHHIANATDIVATTISLGGAIAILAGIYMMIYYYSSWRLKGEGSWVGFGDVKLGFVLALFLADWKLAFLTLFLANLIGSLIAVPGLLLKLLSRGAHIPFGPLLIAGFFISFFWGDAIIKWFLYNGNMLVLY